MIYDVCYTDDLILPIDSGIQDDKIRINEESLRGFLTSNEWNDHAVKRFLDSSLKKTKQFENIRYSGYTNPAFLIRDIRNNVYNPSLIQLDWDLGAGGDAESYLDELLEITTAKIFFLSGNDRVEYIKEQVKDRKNKFQDRGLKAYQKNWNEIEKDAEDNLIEEVVSEYTKIKIDVVFNKVECKFSPSVFLPKPQRLWMLESIFGTNYLMKFLNENSREISENTIEKLFEQSSIEFFVNTTNTRIYSKNGLELHKFYDDKLTEKSISPIYALKNYDLAILETAMEKGTSKIFGKDEK